MNLDNLLQGSPSNLPILEGTFGIEHESLRIDRKSQKLSHREHPPVLGARSFHPYIQTDYSEPQLELITPIAHSTQEARRFLKAITDVAGRSLSKEDYLWPLSMPPRVSEAEIVIAQLDDEFERHYRQHLAQTYGKRLQSMSGIHYNFGLGKDLLSQLFEQSDYEDFLEFKNDLYLKLAQNFIKYRWLLTYLYGASPIAEKGFFDEDFQRPMRSIRNSQYGYVNKDQVKISYSSLQQYTADIESCVADGSLIAEKEFYSPVRLRGAKYSRDFLKQGITYLEFRCFDLNPFEPLGISQETLDTIHLLALALLWLPAPLEVDQELELAHQMNEKIAIANPLEPLPEMTNTRLIIEALRALIEHFHLKTYYRDLVDRIEDQLADPYLTIGGRLYKNIDNLSLEKFGQKQGQTFSDLAWQAPYALKGFETMELSTQLIMFDVIQKGINLEILDENDQFLKLSVGQHIEYVKNGNMTAKDSFIVPLAMENKTVTKKLLSQNGFPVPDGAKFDYPDTALEAYARFRDKPIVIKPKSTNFGLGISIFRYGASPSDYQRAVELAFAEDKSILVEEYIAGTEYRFFVLDGQTQAVLLRRAANVVGDGKSTIVELVEEKNSSPLRGIDHRSPLEKIQLGEIEKLMLEQQGYNIHSIPDKDVRINLRENSNISTGGDSIDMTEQMHPSYLTLASQMTQAIGAWVCGVDLIIPDYRLAYSPERPNATCIELNFNPLMYMHTYCSEGPGQVVSTRVVEKLFPEVNKAF
ncbi:bifunctional glutamate--cysteine ligase GshA/glutathione synthetase GshB [Streptococcus dentapri]|uniref:Glutathione biosynthesis bifunctional protein GshAB n=1 Tax=Streptococcus dentapri TaxID=573564 RepID=A0ABV8D2Q9_9STRE